jgi:hypothetical protein
MKEDERDRLSRVRLETLILARLSVGEARPTNARVSRALYAMLARRFSAVEWRARYADALDALRLARLIEPKRLALTPAGKARLSAALGLASPPRAASWAEFKQAHLPRLFFEEARGRRPATDARAAVLARRLGVAVPARAEGALEAVLEAWLKRELQIAGKLDQGTLTAALLGRELGLRPRQALAAVLRQGVTRLSGATRDRPGDVIDSLAQRWLFGERAPGGFEGGPGDDTEGPRAAPTANKKKSSNGALDLAFVTRAIAKIERALSGQAVHAFGPDKIFIASVWECLAADPELSSLGEGGFKALLVEAHRQGLVDLTRADLVAAMDARDVAASETRHGNATYHFIMKGAS